METKKLPSSRWFRIIPIVFITYSLAYLDRANYSFGAAAGMAEDLHITAGTSSLLGALFFLGYFFFQIPGAAYAAQKSAKKLIFWCLILWGLCAAATGVVTDIRFLYVIRFTLGVVESAVMPAMLIFLSNWFTKEERSRANTFLILGNPVTVLWMSILSGYLVHGFGWRMMFIIEGLPSVIWALFWWKLVQDKPRDAKWLSEGEKNDVEQALLEEQKGMKTVKNYREAFKNPKVIMLSIQYFFWSIGVYGFVMWLPSIIKQAGNTGIVAAGWLSSVPYLLAVILMLSVSYYADRTMNRKGVVWICLLVGAVCFYGSYLVGLSNFWLSYALLVVAGGAMYAPYGPFFAIIPELLPRNVAGGATALINSFGALGSFAGSYIVGYLNGATGSPDASYMFMALSLIVSVIMTIAVKTQSGGVQVKKVTA
ncbi:MFS transporter [Paenibacillus thermoaerophilus]|uniref:MFS transporter n=1 Tax=Paenibacillus thermoaerophilus TaxID=1215385 RepID=A0ABW2V8J4_9BACL|nr:MFS transporter [Paenibacillus thermoaerophilus]TMV07282.1 MFS transporter [Paenibacillus thermoaerophilus]